MLKNNARYASIVRSVCWSARLVNRREINSSFYPGYEEKRSESSAIIDLSDFVRFDVWAVWNRPPWKNENHERLNVPRLTEFLVSAITLYDEEKRGKKKKRNLCDTLKFVLPDRKFVYSPLRQTVRRLKTPIMLDDSFLLIKHGLSAFD